MPIDPHRTKIYHITHVENLVEILTAGGLYSDVQLKLMGRENSQIGYSHIKQRRMEQYRIAVCGERFVGEFVPFYYCPRSPMLYTINKGNTGREPGCQTEILHLVSNAGAGMSLGRAWAVSDGNAGAGYAEFANGADALETVNWPIVNSNDWAGSRIYAKASEFLVADFYPFGAFTAIGCHNERTAERTWAILQRHGVAIPVTVERNWYY
jgi:hypothetical protein